MCDDVIEYNPICLLPSWESQVLRDVAASLQHLALHPFVWVGEMGMGGKTGRENQCLIISQSLPLSAAN